MNILITGGSRGIGKALVTCFAGEGHKVAFIYNHSESEAKKISEITGAFAVQADISDPDTAKAAVKKAAEYLGTIDVLINNAGISQIKLFTDITTDNWDKMIKVNLSGAFYITKEVSKTMISKKSGRIINIGSMWGKIGASCEVHYSASKAGLRGFTLALAKELGPSGITVNCIEPGVIQTDMNKMLDDQTLNDLCDQTPLCRLGTPQDVAALACFLASEKAGFITGQIIGVDGGFAI